MQDWNVVVTVTEGGFVKGIRFLEPLGVVSRTERGVYLAAHRVIVQFR